MTGPRRRNASGLIALARGLLPPPRFGPAATERTFWSERAQRLTAQRRAGLGLSLFVWVAFVGFDLAGFRESGLVHPEVLALRGLGAAGLLAAIAMTYRGRFGSEVFAEWVISGASTGLYACLLTMVTVVDFPYSYIYDYTGLLLFILGFVGVFRLRTRTVLTVMALWFAISLPALAVAELGPAPNGRSVGDLHALLTVATSYGYVAAVSYLFAFMLIGAAIAALLEREARAAFVRERQLMDARRDVEVQTRAVLAAKDELRALAEQQNRNKSKFLADAAHDLSQPVHAVSLLIESAKYALARRDGRKSAELMDAAAQAARITRSSFMTVLELSQLESGLVRPAYAVFDAEDLMEEIVAPLRVIAEAQGVTLRLRHRSGAPAIVRSDRVLLGRALANLLSNAVKYADPAKGAARTVVVSVTAAGGAVRIDVVDNGVGIAPDSWSEVFAPFVQLGNPGRDRDKGLGLGLSIVAATAELLGGHAVGIRSVEGRGTRVWLKAPRHRGPLGPAAQHHVSLAGSGDLASLFVWCVEDDEMAREAMLALLHELGVLTEQSTSLEELQRALGYTERAPDLIISDYRLAGRDTAADVTAAFARRWRSPIPLLVLTGDVAPADDLTARDRVIVLKKPAAPDAVIAAIRRLCFPSGQPPEPAASALDA